MFFGSSHLSARVHGLDTLNPAARTKLSSLAQYSNRSAGEVLYRQGEPAIGVFIVCRGGVKITHCSQNVNDFELACATAVLGVRGVLSQSTYQFTAVVLVNSTIAVIPAEEFLHFVAEYPEADAIGGLVTEQFEKSQTWRPDFQMETGA